MKKNPISGRKHGLRARGRVERLRTTLTFESAAQAYLWCTDRGRAKLVIRH